MHREKEKEVMEIVFGKKEWSAPLRGLHLKWDIENIRHVPESSPRSNLMWSEKCFRNPKYLRRDDRCHKHGKQTSESCDINAISRLCPNSTGGPSPENACNLLASPRPGKLLRY